MEVIGKTIVSCDWEFKELEQSISVKFKFSF